MLTAAAGIRDRVDGLDLGADDYLTKPFAFAELVARVGSLGRRARPALPPVIERAGVRLDLPRRQAWRDGLLLELTPKEFVVLEVLMRAEGAVVSAEELLEKAWDENADPFTNAVRVAVMTLRRKLGQPPSTANSRPHDPSPRRHTHGHLSQSGHGQGPRRDLHWRGLDRSHSPGACRHPSSTWPRSTSHPEREVPGTPTKAGKPSTSPKAAVSSRRGGRRSSNSALEMSSSRPTAKSTGTAPHRINS
jgi:CheY-like chemotaxis protein